MYIQYIPSEKIFKLRNGIVYRNLKVLVGNTINISIVFNIEYWL